MHRRAAELRAVCIVAERQANLRHGFGGDDRARFDGDVIATGQACNAWEAGAGVVTRFNAHLSMFFVADYTKDFDRDGEDRKTLEGNAGLRVAW